ncbi:MAG: hypothetical protein V4591_04085, partial [Bdellovibrionota bacterium]
MTNNVCVIAGEASGDAQGALLVQALKQEFASLTNLQNICFWGAPGTHLMQEGVEPIVKIE